MPEEQTPKPSEPDLTNFIPKSDYEKAIKAKEQELSTLKSKIDEQALALLDTEYIEWKNSKGKTPQKAEDPLDKKDPFAERVKQLEDTVNKIAGALSDAEARQELRETQARFADWNDYVDDIKTFYRNNPDSTASYEQVYRYVKSVRLEQEAKKDPKAGEKPKAPSSEKPGGASPASKALEQKEFKTEREVNTATLEALKDKFPDLGSTI